MPKKKVELFKSLMVGVILRYDTVGRYSEEGVNDFLDELEDYLNHAVQEGHIFASLFLEGDDRPIEALGSSIGGFNMKQSRLLDVAAVFFFELPHLCTKTECEDLAAVVASLVEDFCVVKVSAATLPPAGRADFQKAVLGTAEGRTESFKRDMAKTGALPNPPEELVAVLRFKDAAAKRRFMRVWTSETSDWGKHHAFAVVKQSDGSYTVDGGSAWTAADIAREVVGTKVTVYKGGVEQ